MDIDENSPGEFVEDCLVCSHSQGPTKRRESIGTENNQRDRSFY